jgi:chromosome segregation ATPase
VLQRAEEIEQTRAELESLRADYEAAVDERDKLKSQLSDADAWVFKLAGERRRWEEEASRAQRKLSQIEAETRSQLARIGDQLALSQSELTLAQARAADADAKFEERLIEIGQLTHAIDQIGREAGSAKGVATKLAAQMEVRIGEIAELTNALRNTEQERAVLRHAIDQMEADSAARSNEIAGLTHALAESGEKLAARHNEIARLTVMLAERGAEAVEAATRTEWLRKMAVASQNMPSWWKLLPAKWRRGKEHAYFVRQGLFDARSYLEAYPDVAQDGMDPVRHYLVHGIDEGRKIF